MPLGKEVGLGPGHIVLDGDPVWTQQPHPSFRPMSIVAKLLSSCLHIFFINAIGSYWKFYSICVVATTNVTNAKIYILTSACCCRWLRSKGESTAHWHRSQTSPWTYTHWSEYGQSPWVAYGHSSTPLDDNWSTLEVSAKVASATDTGIPAQQNNPSITQSKSPLTYQLFSNFSKSPDGAWKATLRPDLNNLPFTSGYSYRWRQNCHQLIEKLHCPKYCFFAYSRVYYFDSTDANTTASSELKLLHVA